MAKYNLQADEAVLRSSESSVQRGSGTFPGLGSSGELVLTNLHLIWVKKGPFGSVKQIEYFPLALVKVYNGQAQVRLTMDRQIPRLQICFQNGEEVFRFTTGGRREIERWVDAIGRAVTGQPVDTSHSRGMALPGTEVVAETLRDTFSHFKAAFGGGAAGHAGYSPPPTPIERVSVSCSGCGAPLSGARGTAVQCQYCGLESALN